MKKVLLLIIATAAAFVLLVVPVLAAPAPALTIPSSQEGVAYQRDEIAWKIGPGNDIADNWWMWVDDVYAWRWDDDTLAVLLVARSNSYLDNRLAETHVAVSPTLDGIPSSNGGPIPGQFLDGTEHNPPVASYGYLADFPAGYGPEELRLFVVAHAVVVQFDKAGNEIQRQTGWATGCQKSCWAWSTYYRVGKGKLGTLLPVPHPIPRGSRLCQLRANIGPDELD